MSRPSETVTAAAASIIGAILAILAAYNVDVPDGVEPALVILVGWIAAAVTWYVARRQRAGVQTSAADGKVGKSASLAE